MVSYRISVLKFKVNQAQIFLQEKPFWQRPPAKKYPFLPHKMKSYRLWGMVLKTGM